MAGAEYTPWAAQGIPFQLEYDPDALEQVRRIVVEAYYSMPRGGMEAGGVLLGRFEKGRVEVMNSVPLECEHALGPGFVLSPKDHSALEALVAGSGRQPDGPELKAVGWYHSHTRSGLFLSEEDLRIHARYFPEPWQVALVVRPEHGSPPRAGFFFREKSGKMRGESTALEFQLLNRSATTPPAVWVGAAEIAPSAAVRAQGPSMHETAGGRLPPIPVVVPAAPRWLLFLTLVLGVVAFIAASGFAFRDTEVRVLREDIKRERLRARDLEKKLDLERKSKEVPNTRPGSP